ncbi:adhesion G protein-coupled receptor E1-like [Rana temporaria]|uniref:adhesion G protein-coupled receptor E1-like n=1 Tax=Rana temporaria TaxID=8407 RepID=UPI001AAD4074|nr:adhesion G protein-coupled receptor E1-like [Rana temporaria]
MTGEQQKRLEECSKKNPQDPICSILQASFNFFNLSCQASENKPSDNEAKNQLNQTANTFSQILTVKNVSSTFSNNQTSEFLNNIETAALISFAQAPRTQSVSTPQLNISMKASSDICGSGGQVFSVMTGGNDMEVPCHLVSGKKDGVVLIAYKDLASYINGNFIGNIGDPEENDLVSINSRVISGAITSYAQETFSHPVIFRLVQIKPRLRLYKLHCVFWDPKNNGWSDEGCETKYSNQTHTICSCSHLSSLAVIMAPQELKDDFILTVITYVGLNVSLVCLLLSLLTFILCRSLRSAHTSVLTAICGCLFLAQLLVLVGLVQTQNELVCSIIAGGLHFLFLCAFSWMSIESFLLFMTVRNLRAVNYMTSQRSRFSIMCLLAFGVPTVIVGVTIGVGFKKYRSLKYCWLHPSLVWSFLGPTCVFISTNTILLILTVVLLRKRLASLNTNVSTLKNTRFLTFKALAQTFILGCTWSIGYFQFASFSQIMSYLFTICNSPQGAYIFIVHCLLNHQVRGEYRKFFSKQKKKSQDVSSMQTASRSVNMSNITVPTATTSTLSTENKAQWM